MDELSTEVLLDEYEFISKYGEGLEVNLWMEQAVQAIKELKVEIQRLHDMRDEGLELLYQ